MKKKEVAKELPKLRQVWVPKSKMASKSTRKTVELVSDGRDTSVCLAGRDTLECLVGQDTSDLDTAMCLAQKAAPAAIFLLSSASILAPTSFVPSVKPHGSVDLSRFKITMEDRGKALVKELLGSVNKS